MPVIMHPPRLRRKLAEKKLPGTKHIAKACSVPGSSSLLFQAVRLYLMASALFFARVGFDRDSGCVFLAINCQLD
jgi:hypothetical protein